MIINPRCLVQLGRHPFLPARRHSSQGADARTRRRSSGFWSAPHSGGIEDLIGGTPEDAISAGPPGPGKLLIEKVAEDRQQRNRPLRRLGLRLDLTLFLIPAFLDVDQVPGEVDVFAAEGLQLAAPETSVERSRPQRPILGGKEVDQPRGFSGGDDPARTLGLPGR